MQLSPSRYFNQWLLNHTQKFSSDSEYIFFHSLTHSIMQKFNLNNKINIAKTSNHLINSYLRVPGLKKIKEFIVSYQAFTFVTMDTATERTSRITFFWIKFKYFLKMCQTLFKYFTENNCVLKTVQFIQLYKVFKFHRLI